jgi:hypothetical protein
MWKGLKRNANQKSIPEPIPRRPKKPKLGKELITLKSAKQPRGDHLGPIF